MIQNRIYYIIKQFLLLLILNLFIGVLLLWILPSKPTVLNSNFVSESAFFTTVIALFQIIVEELTFRFNQNSGINPYNIIGISILPFYYYFNYDLNYTIFSILLIALVFAVNAVYKLKNLKVIVFILLFVLCHNIIYQNFINILANTLEIKILIKFCLTSLQLIIFSLFMFKLRVLNYGFYISIFIHLLYNLIIRIQI